MFQFYDRKVDKIAPHFLKPSATNVFHPWLKQKLSTRLQAGIFRDKPVLKQRNY